MSRLEIETHTTITIISMLMLVIIGGLYYYLIPVEKTSFYWLIGAVLFAEVLIISLKFRTSPRRSMLLISVGLMLYTAMDYSFVDVDLLGDMFSAFFLIQSVLVLLGAGCILGYYMGHSINVFRFSLVNAGIMVCQVLSMVNEMYIMENPETAYSLFLITTPDLIIRAIMISYCVRREFLTSGVAKRLKTHMAREFHLALTCLLIGALVLSEERYVFELPETLQSFSLAIEFVGACICWVLLALAILFKEKKRRSVLLLSTGVMIYTALAYSIDTDVSGTWSVIYTVQAVLINFLVVMSFACLFGYYLGYTHNITRLVITTGCIIACSLIPWFVWRYIYHDLIVAEAVFIALLPIVLIRALLVLYLVRPDIIDMSVGNQLKMRLARVESTQLMSNMSYMEKKDMEILLDPENPNWNIIAEGPVERWVSVNIVDPTKRKYVITARVWRGEDFIRCKLSPEKNARGSWGMDFDILEHKYYSIEGKEIIRIYGREGMFLDIYLENPLIHKENKVSDALDRIIREF